MICRLPKLVLATLSCLAVTFLPANAGQYDAQFRQFLSSEVAPTARQQGISQATLDRELKGLTPDTSLPGLVGPGGKGTPPKINFQAEFGSPTATSETANSTPLCRAGDR